MEQERDKKKIFIIEVGILFVFLLLVGGTYAWFTLRLEGTKVNVLKAGTLSLILNDENTIGINKEKAVPMLDEVGETLDSYHFTLENQGDQASDYTIYLDDVDLEENETRMSDSFIKYQLTKDETKKTEKLNTIGMHPNRILDSGTIDRNTTITYDLRLWIDKDTGNDAMGQVVRAKIRVLATQSQQIAKTQNENILNVYRYSTEETEKCITGEEATCVELTERPTNYEPGTIIKYQVNDTESKYFHVMFDNQDTLTMQQRENTIDQTKVTGWYNEKDDNSKGPLTVLPKLEEFTASWTNVKDQTYTMGATTFKDNEFTGCSFDSTSKEVLCTINKYTLPERTAKARMITAQEAGILGCKNIERSCPIWMYNYLYNATNNGGTAVSKDYGYWMMTAYSPNDTGALMVYNNGFASYLNTKSGYIGARAVVVIDK